MTLKSVHDGYVGLAKQSAKGSGIVPSVFVRFLEGAAFEPNMAIEAYPEGGGGPYDIDTQKSLQTLDPSFSLYARPSIAAKLLAYALGADSIAGTAAPYTHTITPVATRVLPWLSIERALKTDLIVERSVDCLLNELVLEGEAGKKLKITASFLSLTQALPATGSSETYDTETPFRFTDGTFTLFGGAFTRISKFKLSVRNNIDGGIQTVNLYREDMQALKLDVDLDFDIVFDSADTNYKTIFYGGGTAPVVDVATGAATLSFAYGTSGSLRQLAVEVPNFFYKAIGSAFPAPTPATLRQAVSAHALKATGSELITATCKTADSLAYI